MTIKLDWKENKLVSRSLETAAANENEQVEYNAIFNEHSEEQLKVAVQACIEKAVSFLSENVIDESRYFLFEWNIEHSTLTIVVTDDTKKNDAKFVVKCCMSALNKEINSIDSDLAKEEKALEYSDFIKYEIKDYLTTCSSFMQFSLIAVFHNKTRDKVELL